MTIEIVVIVNIIIAVFSGYAGHIIGEHMERNEAKKVIAGITNNLMKEQEKVWNLTLQMKQLNDIIDKGPKVTKYRTYTIELSAARMQSKGYMEECNQLLIDVLTHWLIDNGYAVFRCGHAGRPSVIIAQIEISVFKPAGPEVRNDRKGVYIPGPDENTNVFDFGKR